MEPLRGAPLQNVVAAFNREGSALAIASSDGRIKAWDVASGRFRGECGHLGVTSKSEFGADVNGHLDLCITCLVWGPGDVQKKGKKKGKKGGSEQLVAVGTQSGDILMWDIAMGELKWRTPDCHAGGVTSLAFAPGGAVLYSGGADGHLSELDAATGALLNRYKAAKAALSAIAVSPDGSRLLVGTSEVKLFDVATRKRLLKFSAHPTPVRALAFSPDGTHALSAASGERHVALWCCQGAGTAAGVLSMEDPAVSIKCWQGNGDGAPLQVLAVSEIGEAYVWHSLKESKPARIFTPGRGGGGKGQASAKKGRQDLIMVGQVADDGSQLLLARGSLARPQFERLDVPQEGQLVQLSAVSSAALLQPHASNPTTSTSEAAHAGGGGSVAVLGPDHAAHAALQPAHLASQAKKTPKKKKRGAAEDEGEQEDAPAGTSEREGEAEPTLEERLAALGVPSSGAPETSSGRHETPEGGAGGSGAPRADSVIGNSVRRLRAGDALKLLAAAVAKMQSRPSRGVALVPWMRAVLLHHAAYLMSAPSGHPLLASLYQMRVHAGEGVNGEEAVRQHAEEPIVAILNT
eukprot:jgi/Mesen1/9369/ME000610S08692